LLFLRWKLLNDPILIFGLNLYSYRFLWFLGWFSWLKIYLILRRSFKHLGIIAFHVIWIFMLIRRKSKWRIVRNILMDGSSNKINLVFNKIMLWNLHRINVTENIPFENITVWLRFWNFILPIIWVQIFWCRKAFLF